MDFAEYDAAATIAAHGGNPYDYAGALAPAAHAWGLSPPQHFYAPAVVLLWYLPFAFLPFYQAAVAWRLANLVLMAGSVAIIGRSLGWPLISRGTLIALLLLASYEPTLSNLLLGQVQLPMLFLLSVSFWCLHNHRDRLA